MSSKMVMTSFFVTGVAAMTVGIGASEGWAHGVMAFGVMMLIAAFLTPLIPK